MQIIGCLMKNTLLFTQQDKYHFDVRDFDDLFTRSIYSGLCNFYAAGAKSVSVVDLDTYFQKYPDLKSEFDKRNGIAYLQDCEDLCNLDNFDYYYGRLKKFSALRALKADGFDISYWYTENPLAKNITEIQNRFDESNISDIFNYYKKRLSSTEKNYVTSALNSVGTAASGLKELVESFKLRPEIGPPLSGSIYNTVVQGARKGKYYLRSAGSGIGKTRLAVGDACMLSIPYYYDWIQGRWIDRGIQEKVLFITTEVALDEVQTMVLANISGVNERKILQNDMSYDESEVVQKAIEIIESCEDYFILVQIPDPSIAQIESCIRNHVLMDGVQNVFYDYIFSSPSLLNEFSAYRLRQDIVLFMLSTSLKDLATELNVFMSSSTQLSGDYKIQKGIRDQSFLRDAKSIADKADIGAIMVRVCEEEKNIMEPICVSLGLPVPTHVIDVYKNRRSQYNHVKIWCRLDLGTCREEDILITNGGYEVLTDFKELTYQFTHRVSQNQDRAAQEAKEPDPEPDPETQPIEEKKITEHSSLAEPTTVYEKDAPPFDMENLTVVPNPPRAKKGSMFAGLL